MFIECECKFIGFRNSTQESTKIFFFRIYYSPLNQPRFNVKIFNFALQLQARGWL